MTQAAVLGERAGGHSLWTFRRFDADQIDWTFRQMVREFSNREMALRGPKPEPRHEDFRRFGVVPFDKSEYFGNVITTAGYTRLSNLLTNQSATQALDATHTRIGVGDGTTAVANTDTDFSALSGATHRLFNVVTGAGTVGSLTLAFVASFATGDANFHWQEFGIDVGNTAQGTTVASLLFNHALSDQGTKPGTQVWTATATITMELTGRRHLASPCEGSGATVLELTGFRYQR